MNHQQLLLAFTLRLADDASVLAHRISEWCGHAPILEQDIALTNTALDHLGRARSLYQYAAQQFNALSAEDKQSMFSSVGIQNIIAAGGQVDEDDLVNLRDAWDYRNVLLTELPKGDWAYTVARSFYMDVYHYYFFSALMQSTDETLAAVAEKSLKEVTYHLKWSSEWVIRLGDGTEESHKRMQQAVNDVWMYTGELFNASDAEAAMKDAGIAPDIAQLNDPWMNRVTAILEEATLTLPTGTWMQQGGKKGIHSEHLGYILADMQFLQRAYPGMEW